MYVYVKTDLLVVAGGSAGESSGGGSGLSSAFLRAVANNVEGWRSSVLNVLWVQCVVQVFLDATDSL